LSEADADQRCRYQRNSSDEGKYRDFIHSIFHLYIIYWAAGGLGVG